MKKLNIFIIIALITSLTILILYSCSKPPKPDIVTNLEKAMSTNQYDNIKQFAPSYWRKAVLKKDLAIHYYDQGSIKLSTQSAEQGFELLKTGTVEAENNRIKVQNEKVKSNPE